MEQDAEILPPGTRIGNYEIGRLIGRGGMGAVYEATHVLLRKPVALKALLREFTTDAVSVRRFVQEGEAASRVGHEGIVEMTDVGVHGGVAFLVMELLRGESLGARLDREKRLGAEAATDIVLGVCAALTAAHAAGVIHRDLKPENVFLTRDRRGLLIPKLVDFGISKLLSGDPEDMSLTKTGTLVGTPHYMSPEQATGKKGLDHRVDQYALGVILYECVTGTAPFPGDNFLAVLHQIATTLPHPARVLVPTLAAEFDAVIQRAMAYDRDQRYPSMAALGIALLPFASPPARNHWEPELREALARLNGVPVDGAPEVAAPAPPVAAPAPPAAAAPARAAPAAPPAMPAPPAGGPPMLGTPARGPLASASSLQAASPPGPPPMFTPPRAAPPQQPAAPPAQAFAPPPAFVPPPQMNAPPPAAAAPAAPRPFAGPPPLAAAAAAAPRVERHDTVHGSLSVVDAGEDDGAEPDDDALDDADDSAGQPRRSAAEILGVYTGGVAQFSGLDAPRLKELVHAGHVDPGAHRARGPTAARLLKFMQRWAVVRAYGYTMSRRADECEVAIEGLECDLSVLDAKDSAKLRSEFEALCADADEYESDPEHVYARWD